MFVSLLGFWGCAEEGDTQALDIPITGSYTFDRGENGGAGQLRLLALPNEEVQYELSVVNGAPAFNQGFASGRASLSPEHTLELTPTDACRILVRLDSLGASLTTALGDPPSRGFGNAVVPDGIYLRVTTTNPFAAVELPQGGD